MMMMMMAMTIEMVITKKFLKTNKCLGINNQLLKAAGADITSARNKKQKQNKKKKKTKQRRKMPKVYVVARVKCVVICLS